MNLKFLVAGLAAMLAAGTISAAECKLPPEMEAGKAVAKGCANCHELNADKPSRPAPAGPNIHDVFGTMAGSRKDFQYSEGILGARTQHLTWTESNLMEYLSDPKAFLVKVNGADVKHKMYFQLKNEQKRKDVIAYLQAIKGHPECNLN